MKTKINSAFLLFCLLCLATISSAQSGRFSVGAEAALPLGNNVYSEGSYPYGGGLSFRYEKPIGNKIGVMGTLGGQYFYSSLPGGAFTILRNSAIVIPIMFGGKYYVKGQQDGFYGSFEMGLGVSIGSSEVFNILSLSSIKASDTSTNFAFAPGFGYHLSRVDFGMRYQSIAGKGGSFNTLNLRIGFVFGSR